MSILAVDIVKARTTGVAVTVSGNFDVTSTLGVTGYSTFSGISTFNDAVRFPDDTKLHFGNTGGSFGDLQLWHDAGAHS